MLIKFPPTLSEYQERYLKGHILDWCLSHGVVFTNREVEGQAKAVPVTLYPTPFSRHGFDNALAVQQAFNKLYHAVVKNPEFIVNSLSTGVEDEFTKRLLNIYKHTNGRRSQKLTGGIFRSDYLVDKARTSIDEGRQIKQVEFNTVSVSFGGLATRVTEMHRFIAETGRNCVHGEVPISSSLSDVAAGLAQMHQAYDAGNAQTLVLIMTQTRETNISDQRLLEYELFTKFGILCVRASLEQAQRKTTIGENNRLIFVPLGVEISVVYYRTGYGPGDYPSEAEWSAREQLESSHAIQCPSVLTQLAGTKKIQQLLANDKVLEQLQPSLSEKELSMIRKTFVGMWPLDDSELGREGQHLAFESPEHFVLKPQREGGGNNVYKEDIPAYLESIDRIEWANYILMELIEPPKVSNKILKGNEIMSGRIVSELGVFGTVLWDRTSGEELMNNTAGFLLRTKLQSSNEGGIAAGFGCLDAVLLPFR